MTERFGRNTLEVVDQDPSGSRVYGSLGPDDADAMERFGRGRMHYARQFGALLNYNFSLNQLLKRRTKRVLHAGCGVDYLRRVMAENYCLAQEYVGIDLHLPNLRKALGVTNAIPARYRCKSLADPLDYEDDYFDAVVALDVVEHMPTKAQGVSLINELVRVAGDLLIISTPSTPGGVVRASDVHNYEFSPEEHEKFLLTIGKKFRHSEMFGFHMGEDTYANLVGIHPFLEALHDFAGAKVGRGVAAAIFPEHANDVILCFSNSVPIREEI